VPAWLVGRLEDLRREHAELEAAQRDNRLTAGEGERQDRQEQQVCAPSRFLGACMRPRGLALSACLEQRCPVSCCVDDRGLTTYALCRAGLEGPRQHTATSTQPRMHLGEVVRQSHPARLRRARWSSWSGASARGAAARGASRRSLRRGWASSGTPSRPSAQPPLAAAGPCRAWLPAARRLQARPRACSYCHRCCRQRLACPGLPGEGRACERLAGRWSALKAGVARQGAERDHRLQEEARGRGGELRGLHKRHNAVVRPGGARAAARAAVAGPPLAVRGPHPATLAHRRLG